MLKHHIYMEIPKWLTAHIWTSSEREREKARKKESLLNIHDDLHVLAEER